MTTTRAIALGALLPPQPRAFAADCTPAEFPGWYHAAARGELRIPGAVERRARAFRYVLRRGCADEGMLGCVPISRAELGPVGLQDQGRDRSPAGDAEGGAAEDAAEA